MLLDVKIYFDELLRHFFGLARLVHLFGQLVLSFLSFLDLTLKILNFLLFSINFSFGFLRFLKLDHKLLLLHFVMLNKLSSRINSLGNNFGRTRIEREDSFGDCLVAFDRLLMRRIQVTNLSLKLVSLQVRLSHISFNLPQRFLKLF